MVNDISIEVTTPIPGKKGTSINANGISEQKNGKQVEITEDRTGGKTGFQVQFENTDNPKTV